MRDYTKIEAWKLADDLTVAVYECTRSFPKEEIYGLTSRVEATPRRLAGSDARRLGVEVTPSSPDSGGRLPARDMGVVSTLRRRGVAATSVPANIVEG